MKNRNKGEDAEELVVLAYSLYLIFFTSRPQPLSPRLQPLLTRHYFCPAPKWHKVVELG